MNRITQRLFMVGREVHARSYDGPSDALKRKVAEFEKTRKMMTSRKNDQFFVELPESKSYLDTATMPVILAAVGIALFAKLLMMYDESKSQELLERKIKHAPEGQGTTRMLTREEWEEFREEDLKDWTTDVLMDAVARVEEYGRCSFK